MMMKYRSRTDIINMILQAVTKGGATKSRIMYAAYLSYAQLIEYLNFLLSKDMLKYDEMTKIYSMTDKSLRFIHAYDEIDKMGVGLEGLEDYQQQNRAMIVKVVNPDSKKLF